MKRWMTGTVLVVLFAGAAALVTKEARSKPPTEGPSPEEAAPPPAMKELDEPEEPADPVETEQAPLDASLAGALPDGSLRRPASFDFLPDGSPVPPLPGAAPLRIKLGVALFRYKGVQGAGTTTRSREEARALAEKAARLSSFQEAISLGDPGSSVDVGWIRRGVLERSVEFEVFSLEKGEQTKEPVDTPRGFWVAQRIR